MGKTLTIITAIFLFFFTGCGTGEKIKKTSTANIPSISDKSASVIIERFKSEYNSRLFSFNSHYRARLHDITIDTAEKEISLKLTEEFEKNSFREADVAKYRSSLKEYFGDAYVDYKFNIYAGNTEISRLIPNYYRDDLEADKSRIPEKFLERPVPVVENVSRPYRPSKGLWKRNIVLWHSHGWYYDNGDDRWEWQRPRLFQSVEDEIPMSFVIQYLMPMLENSGAIVFNPRECDTQINEVVIDNDSKQDVSGKYYYEKSGKWEAGKTPGFALGSVPYYDNYNPFKGGTSVSTRSSFHTTAELLYTPRIPESGSYAVYISYSASPENVTDAHYIVNHAGGKTEFRVNQQIGGGTWICLGTFYFKTGADSAASSVTVLNDSRQENKILSSDAVRFGGGMGIIARGGAASGRPKYLEGARYNLQYSGFPDTIVYSLNKDKNDYNDDYQCRAEYVNYLYGAPFGPRKNPSTKGLGIPVDLSFAFHTDAGITQSDSTIGSLVIYSSGSSKSSLYPDGTSKLASRDFADIIQTQIVDDIRAQFDPNWTRRAIMDENYYESSKPNVPAVLLELLSHQNFSEMKFVHNPLFRFSVARAIYKSMLKFLSNQNHFPYVVQPLAVSHFSVESDLLGNLKLKWKPVTDKLEPSASPDRYIIYTRIGDGGFDNGRITNDTSYTVKDVTPGLIYSFKVAALNDGGESFPSEIMSAGLKNYSDRPALIVNGFNRLAPPASVSGKDFTGFLNSLDAGVSDKYQPNFTGEQYDFSPSSVFLTNEAPGHGASHADFETTILPGNSFDYPAVHGRALLDNGISFVSASRAAIEDGLTDMRQYPFVDIILGEQKETHREAKIADSLFGTQFRVFPKKMQECITTYCLSGGSIFLSGSYIASDLFLKNPVISQDTTFALHVLKFNYSADHASKLGEVISDGITQKEEALSFKFNTLPVKECYMAEAPDAIIPVQGGQVLFRYNENKFGAASAYKKEYGVVCFGFPFETILGQEARNIVMKRVLNILNIK